MPKDTPLEDIDMDKHAEKIKKIRDKFIDDYDMDPSL